MQFTSMRDLSFTQNRELSWLKFNERVLLEAADKSVPLMERLRFVSIFTSNLDEFFMVRVGSLCDLKVIDPDDRENKSGMTADEQLNAVFEAVRPLVMLKDEVYADLRHELAENGICELSYEKLDDAQRSYVNDYYKQQIRPLVSPQVIDRSHPFPHLRNKALYTAALLDSGVRGAKRLLGIVDIPSTVPPIIMIPGKDKISYIRSEVVVAAHLKKIFKIYNVVEQAVIAITRNADISMDEEKFDDSTPDFLNYMDRLLRKRERLAPVRLEMEGNAPGLTKLLNSFLKLSPAQIYRCASPLKLSYAFGLSDGAPALYNKPYSPIYPAYLDESRSMTEQIRERDVLLFYPYQSIKPFLDLLKEAARDPQVTSIKITIYRLAQSSAIAKTLCAAAEQGKEVTVLMELRARFDERNNIDWSQELEESGCRIIYGPEHYKCHAKICLITRREKNGLSYITQIGTGNYNEKTSGLYTDFCMMTARENVARDAVQFFDNMLIGNLFGEYETLLVAPNSMKNNIMAYIDGEIAKGASGRVIIKCNSVTERDLIDKLSEASCAGVKVDLIVRGICCILPGIPGKTENITITSVVGRYLEHSRVYAFGKGEDRKVYISSADIMTRNQIRRVEVACPVQSEELKAFIIDYLNRILSDNIKAKRLCSDGSYVPATNDSATPMGVQQYYLDNPIMLTASKQVKQPLLKRLFGRRS